MVTDRPVAIDMFSGAGGLAEGLLAAGINVAVAIEKHPHPALTCAFNHPNTTVMVDDVSKWGVGRDKYAIDNLASLLARRVGKKKVDLVVGGPPCQGFSSAGLRNPDDPRNGLFVSFLRVVDYFRPRMFLFENVPGFARLCNGAWIAAIVKRFREMGYRMHDIPEDDTSLATEFPLLDAAYFGVPQNRKRFLLVGWLPGKVAREFQWPKTTHGPGSKNGSALVTTEEALSDLEFLSAGQECHTYQEGPNSEYQQQRRRNSGEIFNHLATKHQPDTVRMYRYLRQGSTIRTVPREHRSGKQTMSRLRSDTCSKAVLALPDDIVHYRRHRIPTVREMARLQSFDDDFVFLGKRTTSDKNRRIDVPQYTQVGNAVPPLLAKAIGVAMLAALGFRPKDLRDLSTRRTRCALIRGSSGFSGYTLAPDAQGQLDLVDNRGICLTLPVSEMDKPVIEISGIVEWNTRGRRILAWTGTR